MAEYNCTHCKYSYSRMNCDVRIKNNCEGCPMVLPNLDCKCVKHIKVGEECEDFVKADD